MKSSTIDSAFEKAYLANIYILESLQDIIIIMKIIMI